MNSQLARYVIKDRNSVEGWLSRIDAEIFRIILDVQLAQRVSGAVAEIGVHHGKAFIAMCLGLRPEEMGFAIDIFDEQHLNSDSSGRGNRTAFEGNLSRFGIHLERVVIDPRDSRLVAADQITTAVGPVRFFSIDGGHWLGIVQSDLCLAEATLATGGVIALDDFCRAEWPEVSAGYFAWYSLRTRPLVPFAIGFNKLYLCEECFAPVYQRAMREDEFLHFFRAKDYELLGSKIPVYQRMFLPEWTFGQRLVEYTKLFHPAIFMFGTRVKWRLSALTGR